MADELMPLPTGEPRRRAPSVRAGARSFAVLQALRVLASFGTAMLVSRQLGADGKGAIALLQQTPSILSLAMGFGFAGVAVYYVGSGKRTPREALGDSLLVAGVATVVGVPVSFGLMWLVPAIREWGAVLVALASAVVPVSVLTACVAGILVGGGRPEAQARAQSVGLVLNVTAVGWLYLTVRLSVEAAVVVGFGSTVVTLLLLLAWLGTAPRFAGSIARIVDAASYARRRYFIELASMLEMRIDVVVLGALTTTTAVGIYSVAVSLAEMLWVIPRVAETPLLSRFLHEREESGIELVALAVRLTVAVEIVLLVGAVLLLAPLVALFFGPSFRGATALFWILAPGVVMNGVCGPLVAYLTSRGHQYPWLSAVSVAGNVALNVALVPLMGTTGAAVASAITYSAGGVWLVRRFVDETGHPWATLFIPRWDDLWRLAGVRDR